MTINLEFNDFEEMTEFAEKLIAKERLGENKSASKKASKKQEAVPKKTSDDIEMMESSEISVQEENKAECTETTEKEEKTDTTNYTLEEVRSRLVELTRSGKQKEVKTLLSSFGATNVSALLPKDYSALMEKAGDL